jgi:hypothetical protein
MKALRKRFRVARMVVLAASGLRAVGHSAARASLRQIEENRAQHDREAA